MDDQQNLFSDLAAEAPVDTVDAVDEQQLLKDLKAEKKYGDSETRAFAESAARAATLGLSDIASRIAGVPAADLAGREEYNPASSMAGTAVGVVGPLGTQGPLAAATPISKLAKAGKAAEDFASLALKSKVRSDAVKKILSTAAGAGAEGAAFGVGQTISEAALGRADFNAENIVANAGAGALLGAGFGAGLGSVKASLPLASKLTSPIRNKVSKSVQNLFDPEAAAMELTGLPQKRILRINEYNPTFFKDLPTYFREKINLKPGSTADDIAIQNVKVQQSAISRIVDASKKIDDAIIEAPHLAPSRQDAYGQLLNTLLDERKALELAESISSSKIATLERYADDILKLGTDSKPFSFKEFDSFRKTLQGIKYKGGGASESFEAEVAERLRAKSRRIIDNVASTIAEKNKNTPLQTIAADLKSANKDFYTADVLRNSLLLKASKQTLLKWGDIVEASALTHLGGPVGMAAAAGRNFIKTDLRRNMAVLADMKLQADAAQKLIKDSVSAFVGRTKSPARSLSLKALTASGFALSEDRKPPKNRKEAFQNISKTLQAYQTDPDKLQDRLIKSTYMIANAAPNTAAELQVALVRGVQFLQSKLPKSGMGGASLFMPREFVPSSMELAKFERYLQVVENPLSALEDLERGTLTREHVEALKIVYPAIYRELQDVVLEAVAKEPMPYSKRLQLGVLLDVPTDESLEPDAIVGLQSNFGPQQPFQQQQPQAGNPAPSRADKLDGASRQATGAQKVSTNS